MEPSELQQFVTFAVQFLFVGYWVLGWLVWKGWVRGEDTSRFGRFANKSGEHFGRVREDARWGLFAALIVVGCAVAGLLAFGVAHLAIAGLTSLELL